MSEKSLRVPPYKIWSLRVIANQMQENPHIGADLWNLQTKIESEFDLSTSDLSLLKSTVETEMLTHESGALDDLLMVVSNLLITEMRSAGEDLQKIIKKIETEKTGLYQIRSLVPSGGDGAMRWMQDVTGGDTWTGILISSEGKKQLVAELCAVRSKLEGA